MKALMLPVPVRTTSREIHPLVNTMPTPNIIPPKIMARSGMFELKKRCSENDMKL